MRAAGLTHGGFYKHFGSRDDLVAEAVQRALADNEGFMTALLAGAADPLVAFVDWYTSADHRDSPSMGCGVVSFSADVPRADERVRAAYIAQVERYLEHLEPLLGDRRRAAAALSTWSERCWWPEPSGRANCPTRYYRRRGTPCWLVLPRVTRSCRAGTCRSTSA